jgi:hypothetical protein
MVMFVASVHPLTEFFECDEETEEDETAEDEGQNEQHLRDVIGARGSRG